MIEPTKFDLIYDRLCKLTGSVLSIYNFNFQVNISPDDLSKSKAYELIYTEQIIGLKEKTHTLSVYKNTTNIYFYIETNVQFNSIKLLFDPSNINHKDLELMIINLRKQPNK